MRNSYCFKHFRFLGVNPHYSSERWHFILNISTVIFLFSLVLYKFYLERDLKSVESCTNFFLMILKYLTLVHSRKVIKKIVAAMDLFWNSDVSDDQMAFLLRHMKGVETVYKYIFISGVSMFAVKPFFVTGSSMFDCYVPHGIPFPFIYVVELHLLLFGASSFISFNIFICCVIIRVVVQFKFLNLKIQELDFMGVENGRDFARLVKDLKLLVKYQQFLIRCVEDLNKLLSVPVGSLMVVSVTMLCINMYTLSVHQGSIVDQVRITITSSAVIVEYFMVYGLPAQLLMDEAAKTADVIYYDCKWYLPAVRPLLGDFLFMIMRSQRDVCIKAADYHVICNQTALMMLKTAYSFYTFLQKVT